MCKTVAVFFFISTANRIRNSGKQDMSVFWWAEKDVFYICTTSSKTVVKVPVWKKFNKFKFRASSGQRSFAHWSVKFWNPLEADLQKDTQFSYSPFAIRHSFVVPLALNNLIDFINSDNVVFSTLNFNFL